MFESTQSHHQSPRFSLEDSSEIFFSRRNSMIKIIVNRKSELLHRRICCRIDCIRVVFRRNSRMKRRLKKKTFKILERDGKMFRKL